MTSYDDYDYDGDDVYDGQAYALHPHGQDPVASATQGITTKIPPSFDGRTSWFSYEEQVDDWVDLTTLDPEKHGPALKNRLLGEAAVYKPLLDRDTLKDPEKGVQYFKDTLRPHFVKGSQSVFLWRFFQLLRCHRGQQDLLKWIGKLTVIRKRVQDAWMDLMPPFRQDAPDYLAEVARVNARRAGQNLDVVDPLDDDVYQQYIQRQQQLHRDRFPLNDNLFTLTFIVLSDLTETQRERLQSTMSLRGLQIQQYTFEAIRDAFMELFCAPRSSLDNPSLRSGGTGRAFVILDQGHMDGQTGFWCQDDTTGEEGFLPEFEDTFWVFDDMANTWLSQPFRGRTLRRGKGKGKGKGARGRSRFFGGGQKGRPKGKPKGWYGQGDYPETPPAQDPHDAFWQKGKGKKGKGKDNPGWKGDHGKGAGKSFGGDPGKGSGKPWQASQVTEQSQADPAGTWAATPHDSSHQPSADWQGSGQPWPEFDWMPGHSGFVQITNSPNLHDSSISRERVSSTSGDIQTSRERVTEPTSHAFAAIRAQTPPDMSRFVDLRRNPTYVVLDLGCTRAMGSRKAIEAFAKEASWYGIQVEYKPCQTNFAFANSQTAKVTTTCIIWFPTSPPSSTQVDVLEEGTVPILFSLPQMMNLRMTIRMEPGCAYVTCLPFRLHDTPLEVSTTGHLVLDLTSLQYCPSGPTMTATPGLTFATHDQTSRERVTPDASSPNTPDEQENAFPASAFERDPNCKACQGAHTKHTCDRIRRQRDGNPPEEDARPPEVAEPAPERAVPKDEVPIVPPVSRERTSVGRHSGSSTGPSEVPPPPVPEPLTGDVLAPDTLRSTSRQRLLAKLESETELRGLHLKHFHMSTLQFRRRTSHLGLPQRIYDKYDNIVKTCEYCNRHKPAPQRSRVSGLRAENFGDLIFLDHGQTKIGTQNFLFLIVLDGATGFLAAYSQQTLNPEDTIRNVHDWMDTYSCTPKCIVADMAFHTPRVFQDFYRLHNIRPMPTGPATPWPNRAESGVRLFKRFFRALVDDVMKRPNLNQVTPRQLIRKAASARNTSVTRSGKTPLELAFGRRPRDLLDVSTMDPQQLTTNRTEVDKTNEEIQKLAMKIHLEVIQQEDLRRDLAASLRFVDGPFFPGDRVYFWQDDPSGIRQGRNLGQWIKARVVAVDGSIVSIDTGTQLLRVNQSKLKKEPDMTDKDRPATASPDGVSRERAIDVTDAPAEDVLWMCSHDEPLDLLQLFSTSARLSAEASKQGLRVGPPIDMRTATAETADALMSHTWNVLEKCTPSIVYMTLTDSKTTSKSRASECMNQFMFEVAAYQLSHNRGFVLEQPEEDDYRYEANFSQLGQDLTVKRDSLDTSCFMTGQFGRMLQEQDDRTLRLTHNLGQTISPLFRRHRNPDRPKNKAKSGYVHSWALCHEISDLFVDLLGSTSEPAQCFFLSDVLDFMSLSVEDEKKICDDLKFRVSGQSIPDTTTFSTLAVQQPLKSVLQQHVRHAMRSLDTLPHGQQLFLAGNSSSLALFSVPHVSTLRRYYLPDRLFFHSMVLRGTLGISMSVKDVDTDDNAWVLMWKTGQPDAGMRISPMTKSLFQDPRFDPKPWTIVVFWQETKDRVMPPKPMPRRPTPISRERMSDDGPTMGGPPPTPPGGPSDGPSSNAPMDDHMFSNPDTPIGSLQHDSPGPPPPPGAGPMHHDIATPGSRSRTSRENSTVQEHPITPMHVSPAQTEGHQSVPTSRSRSRRSASLPPTRPATPPELARTGQVRPAPTPVHTDPVSSPKKKTRADDDDEVSRERTEDDPAPGSSRDPILPTQGYEDDHPPQDAVLEESGPEDEAPQAQGTTSGNTADSQATIPYPDDGSAGSQETIRYPEDLYVSDFPSYWSTSSSAHRLASNTGSFSFARDENHQPIDINDVHTQPSVLSCYCGGHTVLNVKSRASESQLQQELAFTTDTTEQHDLQLCLKATAKKPALKNRSRKEVSSADLRKYKEQFDKAKKDEYKSWLDNEVFDLVDVRKVKCRNYVTGRWVLTIKTDQNGAFLKCKARWVLRGFQDKQKDDQQTDSPAATRPGFRLTCQLAANRGWHIFHMDLKTAFLQGEAYDNTRDVVCQLPPEAGHPWYIAARLKKPAYGMNDAPRRWWNIVDQKLRSYGMIPTRADRCCYVLYDKFRVSEQTDTSHGQSRVSERGLVPLTPDAVDYFLDPITGSPAHGQRVAGVICLHVDDLFMTGDRIFQQRVMDNIRKDFQVGSEMSDNVDFVGQRIRWTSTGTGKEVKHYVKVDQTKAIEELTEIVLEKGMKDETPCTPSMHTAYRSVLGQLNWLQSRTQFHICYRFSRCASASAKPTIGDVRNLNKVVRTVRATPVTLNFWPLQGTPRLVGYPDAAYRNNADKTSQRAHVIFLAVSRERTNHHTYGSLIDFESHKINRTVLSTTVSELYAFMKCYGTCQFLRGLWKDISGETADIHMRTDANNLVTTASTTHLPEQKETIHMIQMLRKEACSGSIHDLAHIRTALCLSDCLTKGSAKPDELLRAVDTGVLHEVDLHPNFRTLIKHRAFLNEWKESFIGNRQDYVLGL